MIWKYLAAVCACIALGLGAASLSSGGTQKAPYACTQAIHEARVLGYLSGQGFGIAAGLLPLIHDAAVAGADGDSAAIYRIAAKLNAATVKINRLTKSTNHTVGLFNGYASLCR